MAKTHFSKPAPAVEIDLMSSTVNLESFMYSRTFLTCMGDVSMRVKQCSQVQHVVLT